MILIWSSVVIFCSEWIRSYKDPPAINAVTVIIIIIISVISVIVIISVIIISVIIFISVIVIVIIIISVIISVILIIYWVVGCFWVSSWWHLPIQSGSAQTPSTWTMFMWGLKFFIILNSFLCLLFFFFDILVFESNKWLKEKSNLQRIPPSLFHQECSSS